MSTVSKKKSIKTVLETPVQPIPLGEYGPCMKALNPMQQGFVIACINMGVGLNYTEAARLAGYADPGGIGAKVSAHRLAHDEKVIVAIQEQTRKVLKAGTIQATSVLLEAMTATKPLVLSAGKEDGQEVSEWIPDWKVRLTAANSLLDRGGMPSMSEHTVTVAHTPQSRAEKLAELKSLALSMGMDPRSLLGNLADVVEGDLKVINEGENDGTGQQAAGTKGK